MSNLDFEELKPTDTDFDDMLHALGRPVSPSSDVYRNYYCCEVRSATSAWFEALGMWDFVRLINGGRDAIYCVNGAGKRALAEWMLSKSEPEPEHNKDER
jgi:hypothetical protein